MATQEWSAAPTPDEWLATNPTADPSAWPATPCRQLRWPHQQAVA